MWHRSFGLALGIGVATLLPSTPCLAAPELASAPGEISVTVGELLENLFLSWKYAYQNKYPGHKINHLTTPNAAAIQAFIDGKTPIGPSTRELTSSEIAEFKAKWGYPPTRVAVASDGVVILVNRNNPIKELKMEQLDAMYSASRLQGWPKDVETWGDLGLTSASWVHRPIERWGHPGNSGTLVFFRQVVQLGGKDKPDTKTGSDVEYMFENIMANQAAIGYGSISQIYSTLKAVPLVPRGAKEAVDPTPATVADGSYPLGRFLYFHLNKPAGKPLTPEIKSFITFVLSPEGQSLVAQAGFVPLSQDMVLLGMRHLAH